jgi:hypothetical protein
MGESSLPPLSDVSWISLAASHGTNGSQGMFFATSRPPKRQCFDP